MLGSHQPLRLCRPPPELLGQRDVKIKCGRLTAIVNSGEQLPVVAAMNHGIFELRDEQLASEFRR